jgi:hypothetical protein
MIREEQLHRDPSVAVGHAGAISTPARLFKVG